MIKTRKIIWTGHVVGMKDNRNADRIVAGKPRQMRE
jgi:hypothetical protein